MSCVIVSTRTSRLPWRRSNLAPRASSSLLAHRGVLLARRPRKCRRLGAPWTPPPAQGPRRRLPSRSGSHCHRSGNRRYYFGSKNRRHHVTRSGSRGQRRTRSRTTAVVARVVANELGWSMKNWTLAIHIFFYRRLDLVRLDRIAPSSLGFL
jgi:hypothetical protein